MSETIKGSGEEAGPASSSEWDSLGDVPSWDEIKTKREQETEETGVFWVNDEEVQVTIGDHTEVMKAENVPKKYGDNKGVMMEYNFLTKSTPSMPETPPENPSMPETPPENPSMPETPPETPSTPEMPEDGLV